MNIQTRMTNLFAEAMIENQSDCIVAALRWFGPLTRPTLTRVTGIKEGTVYSRCADLIGAGRIRVCGKEVIDGQRNREILEYVRDMVDQAEEGS